MALARSRSDASHIDKHRRRSLNLMHLQHPYQQVGDSADSGVDIQAGSPIQAPGSAVAPRVSVHDFSPTADGNSIVSPVSPRTGSGQVQNFPVINEGSQENLAPPQPAFLARPTVQFQRIHSFQQSYREQEFSPEHIILKQAEDDPKAKLRPRSLSHHLSSTKIPSRTWLKYKAKFWRAMMAFAADCIPKVKAPRRLKPAFVRDIHTSPEGQRPIRLHFWVPPDYWEGKKVGKKFPVVVDYHGGGFCLGTPTDDRHWARIAIEQLSAVVVGVDYRLAPEHPFPGPVDDSIDALLYLSANASSLSLDMGRTALSGFSAGANLSFATPLRLEFFTKNHEQMLSVPSQASNLQRWPSTAKLLADANLDELRITNIVAWYPLLDWTSSRDAKRRNSRNPAHTLPAFLTELFDYSYLPPPDFHGYHCSPYASPALAPDYMLREGLPQNIQLWLCEWDMLLAEGEKFSTRLQDLGKDIKETLIPGVPHGFDQNANPFRDQARIDGLYRDACRVVRTTWGLDGTTPAIDPQSPHPAGQNVV